MRCRFARTELTDSQNDAGVGEGASKIARQVVGLPRVLAADEHRPRHAVGAADDHRVGVLDRAGVAERAVAERHQPEPVPPAGGRVRPAVGAAGASGRASAATAGASRASPGRASRGSSRCPTAWRPTTRRRRAPPCSCAAAPTGGRPRDGSSSNVRARRMPWMPSGCEQPVRDDGLVRPAGDLLDEQAEQAVVEVRVAVRRPGRRGEAACQTLLRRRRARVGAAAEERVVVRRAARSCATAAGGP